MIYLDNAATTPLDPLVFEAMKPYLLDHYGNPSSIHSLGRKVRVELENARKKVAELMGCSPGEIIFTSGGTEGDNTLILGAIMQYGIKNIITSPLEHHAVLHTIQHAKREGVAVHEVACHPDGHVDLNHLEKLLKSHDHTLVTLMHANNEIGNLLELEAVAELCETHHAYFHSDTVQTVGRYPLSLGSLGIHGAVASAHKFHGPKGIGFMYVDSKKKISPLLHGGGQERKLRCGTENVSGIIGLARALELSCANMDEHRSHIEGLKNSMIAKLTEEINGISFHGDSAHAGRSHFSILNVSLPESPKNDMLLFNLDMKGIAASGGSACSSGANAGSHVIRSLYPTSRRGILRFSFSKLNTQHQIDQTVQILSELYNGES